MNSNDPSANSSDTYAPRWSDLVGGAIALITLILPVFVISHYSAPVTQNSQEILTSEISHHVK